MIKSIIGLFCRDKPIEVPYRVVYEPGGCFKNEDGSFSVYTIKKGYGYWGNIINAEIEENRTRV